jgi:hypothetical protein
MSVDVRDHRRYLEGKASEEPQERSAPKSLLQQVEIAKETGDPRLDKLLRVIASRIEESDKNCIKLGLESASCIEEKLFRLKQGEFFFNKGILEGLKELAKVPQQIIDEETPASSIIH